MVARFGVIGGGIATPFVLRRRRRHTRLVSDWSSDVCSSDLAGDENTGAAGLAPDPLVGRSRRTIVVVARQELARVDPQFAVEEMQFFYARMRMWGVTRVDRKSVV